MYRPDSNITIRTFEHLRNIERDNLLIFKEIYQNKPTEAAPSPIVYVPAPAPAREPVPEIAPDGFIRETEEQRKQQVIIGKFRAVVFDCDGKIKTMAAGNVEHWLDQVKDLAGLYGCIYNAS